MDTFPLITIGLTCYNAQDSIVRALKSAQAQDWPDLEILVVDDCSSDNSANLVAEAAAQDNRIRLIRHEVNQGPGAARQTIFTAARGEFIAFFDDDDESLPQRVRTQYERIMAVEKETGQRLIACYASGVRKYPNGYEKTLEAIGSRGPLPHGAQMAGRILYFETNPDWFYGSGTPSCSLFIRRDTVAAAGGFDPAFRRVEDLDFAVRLALLGGVFAGCPEPLFIQHASTGSDKSQEKNLIAEIQLAEKHKDYLETKGLYAYATQWPRVRYHHFRGSRKDMILALLPLLVRYPLRATKHFIGSGVRRFLHERNINRAPAHKFQDKRDASSS